MIAAQSTDAPPTPTGYRVPYSFGYPKLGMNIGAVASVLILFPLLGALTWLLQGKSPLSGSIGLSRLLFYLGIAAVTIVVHELIHGLAYRILGYRVSYGIYWKLGFIPRRYANSSNVTILSRRRWPRSCCCRW